MLDTLFKFSQSKYFFLAGAAYLLSMEGIALFYQYGLEYYPCALCVQIRAWVTSTIIIAFITSFMVKKFWWRWMGLTLVIALMFGALYTSWYSWGVENGTIVSSCSMGAGFPEFMLLDQWIPWLFRADGFCGQSPMMLLGLSMNEGLLITLSIPTLVLCAVWLLHLRAAFRGEAED